MQTTILLQLLTNRIGQWHVGLSVHRETLPFARRVTAITSAFLLARSVFGLAAAFVARAAFFADLAFLAGLRPLLGFAASGAGLMVFSLSIAFSLIEFLLDRVAVVTVITPVRRNGKQNL
jgi:hypothetical protein